MPNAKQKKTNFKYTPTQDLPKLGKIKTKWDLKKHYYKSEKDPQIEKDLVKTERAYKAFVKKYKGKDFTSTSKKLLTLLRDYEKIAFMPESYSAAYYLSYRGILDASDAKAQNKLQLIEDRMTKVGNSVLFVNLTIGKIDKKKQKEYLRDPLLKKYWYDLRSTFEDAKHTLSEPEERILNLKSDVSHGKWVHGTDKMLSKRSVTFKGQSLPLPAAIDHVNAVAPKERQKLWKLCTTELRSLAEVAENELNAVINNKKINDELRGYTTPYEATIRGYENNEKSVLALVDAISTKGFALSRKYYALKARYAGKKSIPYANRSEDIGKSLTLPFSESVTMCRDTFYGINPTYGKIFDTMLQDGHIDVYPKQGKTGGAFCAHASNIPTFVMLNQVDNTRSFSTLAHEMGHAIHSERSKTQPHIYEGYSTTTAETASTFFERQAQSRLIDVLPESYKLNTLNQRIGEAVATICRQIAFFNFEKELHETIRQQGGMTWQEMAKLLQKHMQAYMGPSVEITEDDGLSFVYVSHFRNFFYVYTYAYGLLVSNLMAKKYSEDPSYIKQIETFLTAGGSDTVENIFGKIGIDTNKTETFLESLKTLENDIKLFEKLTT